MATAFTEIGGGAAGSVAGGVSLRAAGWSPATGARVYYGTAAGGAYIRWLGGRHVRLGLPFGGSTLERFDVVDVGDERVVVTYIGVPANEGTIDANSCDACLSLPGR